MKKQAVAYGIVGLIVGAVVSGLLVMHFTGNQPQHTNNNQDSSLSMTDMVDSLEGKTGDDFDKAFIDGMIEHHQGAIDMAKLAKENAKHDEVKQMADDIIAAQSKEIDMMQQWKADWGYTEDNTPQGHQRMNH
jgi:uncharacterized protein (DUF305 family)